ncbi:hypothetical protein RJ641_008902 [Dillenia turbinata]|uniref:Uncharacterized protein n=1 Tax=Dillenia turbinata TaxID=194707 RepID=A0AAN8ZB67_9MAGN
MSSKVMRVLGLVSRRRVGIVEWQVPRHQYIQDHPARPDVHLGPVVPFLRQDLRGHVGGGAAERVEEAVEADLIADGAEPKVGDLEVAILVEEEVLGLEVTVEDATGVAVSDGGDKLLEVAAAEVLGEAALGDLGEELAAFEEFHDEVDLGLRSENLVKLDDVGVVEAAHDGDLALDVGHQGGGGAADKPLLADDLDGHALPRTHLPRVVHLGEGPAPQQLPHFIFAEQGLVPVIAAAPE